MAQFTRVNGDYKPLINYDAPAYTNTGVNAVVSAATVQPQGPKLQFLTVTGTGAFSTTQVKTIFQTVEQLSSVYLYEYTSASNDTLALALYPVAGWDLTALDAALTAAGVTGTTSTATATFTN